MIALSGRFMYRDERYKEAKYRVKISHFTEKGHDITGVMHVGTNYGYEFEWYRKMGIEYFIGFEPLPSAIKAFQENYPTLATGKEFFFPFALGNNAEVRFLNITSGDGQGSSFLPEVKEFAQTEVIDEEFVYIKRFYDLFIETRPLLPLHQFDCLVLDVQGYELEVLKGMEGLIRQFKFLNIECSEQPVYEGGPSGDDIVDYLVSNGFKQDSPMEIHNDVLFIKEGV